ncbi:hypothetical protein Pcinc_040535 [Petrolisthes cinctipes]|uniref:Uncharacterized protein n=1 Tax=Petrolisthes cinctipes TaxID=88211 RepID=A0AAE1BLD3_PETCI|nr:hypothetical protein Pcinc_040535 [Petrolisthes cinctipes]
MDRQQTYDSNGIQDGLMGTTKAIIIFIIVDEMSKGCEMITVTDFLMITDGCSFLFFFHFPTAITRPATLTFILTKVPVNTSASSASHPRV